MLLNRTKRATISSCCWIWESREPKYLHHRYQIDNDKVVWKMILETADMGNTFWMDYPEKYHWNTKIWLRNSAVCTVSYYMGGLVPSYVYHFSNDTTHDSIFTFAVINHSFGLCYVSMWKVTRFKSDSCLAQYKNCKHVFTKWLKAAVTYLMAVIWVSYGWVLRMPWAVSVWYTQVARPLFWDCFFNSAGDIQSFLQVEMADKPERSYYLHDEKTP